MTDGYHDRRRPRPRPLGGASGCRTSSTSTSQPGAGHARHDHALEIDAPTPSIPVVESQPDVGEARRAARGAGRRGSASTRRTPDRAGARRHRAGDQPRQARAAAARCCCATLDAATAPELEMLALDRGPGIADVAACLRGRLLDRRQRRAPASARCARMSDGSTSTRQSGHGTAVLAQHRGPKRRPRGRAAVRVSGAVAWPSPARPSAATPGRSTSARRRLLGVGRRRPRPRARRARRRPRAAVAASSPSTTRGAGAQVARGASTTALRAHARRRRRRRRVDAGRAERAASPASATSRASIVDRRLDPARRVSHNGTARPSGARASASSAIPGRPASLLVMHSDGLGTHWSLDRYPGLRAAPPGAHRRRALPRLQARPRRRDRRRGDGTAA